MPRDFLSSQIRTSQIIASRSLGTGPSILIISASNADGSGGTSPAFEAGSDTFLFVSGSRSTDAFVVLGGSAKVSGSLTVFDNVTLGSSTSDTISFVGRSNSNIVPDASNLYSLGIPIRKWLEVVSLSGSFDYARVVQRAVFDSDLSGSLQSTAAGLPYLVAGSNVTISTGSNGQITISSTGGGGGGGDSYWTEAAADKIYSTGSVAIGIAGSADSTGTDVSFFVSGSIGGTGTSGVSVFGGDAVVSGSLTIGTGSITITSNDITFFGGVAQISSGSGGLTLTDSSGTATLSDIIAGSFTQDSYWQSTVAGVASTTGSVEIAGDLTVNGTTTTVDTQNLLVKDPVVYFGSGSVGTNRNGGIALASGSSETDQALVWGRVANDTWGAGRLDVENGTVTDLTGMTLLPVRASKFEVGGANAYLTSSAGNDPILSGSGVVTLGSNAGQSINFQFGSVQFATIAPLGTDVKIGSGAGKKLTVSGSQVIVQAAPGPVNGGLLITTDSTPFVSIASGSISNSISIRGEQAGSTLDLFNTNSTTVNFAGAATSILVGAVGSNAGSTTIRNKLSRFGNVTSTSWTLNGASANFGASTFTDTDGVGSIPARVAVSVSAPTFASSNSVTIGNAASLYVVPPVAGANTSFTNSYAAWINGGSLMGGHVIPSADVTHNLGSATARWANIYTGDLHLKNDRGDWTIVEEEEFLSITNNKTGKRYKFVMEEI